jgi:hypothetical protein
MSQLQFAGLPLNFARGIIRGADRWHDFMVKLESVRAHNGELPEHMMASRIREHDLVSVRNKLQVEEHFIPSGSRGVVMREKVRGRVFVVRFYCDPGTLFALSACDLQIAV